MVEFVFTSKKNLSSNELNNLFLKAAKSELKNILETKKITHIIACGYQMSNLIDNNPAKGAEINKTLRAVITKTGNP